MVNPKGLAGNAEEKEGTTDVYLGNADEEGTREI